MLQAMVHDGDEDAYKVTLGAIPQPGDVIDVLTADDRFSHVEVLNVSYIIRDGSPPELRTSTYAQDLKLFVRRRPMARNFRLDYPL